MFKKGLVMVVLGSMAISVFFAGSSFAFWEDNLEVNPRVNVVHLTVADINTQYYFLAAVPMAVFHHNGKVYSSLLIPDILSDSTVAHIVDDWKVYLNQHSGEKRHANFVGGVSSSVQDAIKSKFGITDDQDVDIIEGTPIEVANQIAEKDWKHSDYVVIAPYVSSPSDHTIESISNAAAIAAILNAPLLFTDPAGLSTETLTSIARVGATSAVLVEIDDLLSDNVNTQLTSAGIGISADLTTEAQIVSKMRELSGHSTLCGIVNNWQNLPAALAGARYGGYVFYLPSGLNKLANDFHKRIMADPELQSFYKLTKPLVRREWMKLTEDQIAQNFYNWLTSLGGEDPDTLETVITFEPQGTGGGDLETTFDRAITGDFSDLTRKGAITGRMPLSWQKNIALLNRTSMFRATIFANPRPTHITLAMNAYEVQHLVDEAGGNTPPDSWGLNHITNEIFGWPYRGWCGENGYFPWDDIHSNAPDLSPILPPGPGDGPDHDPGQFASFLSGGYETHFHSGSGVGSGSHPAQPDVSNIGFVQDVNDGSAFLYFSCHGGGTAISVRNTDNGIAQDGSGEAWGDPYWPDDDGRTYDGSAGGSYSQTDLDYDLTNAHGMMIAYNACGMANGYMNEILLEHGGAVSIGSYTSVSFCGSGWWWNLWVHLVTHEGYSVGEAAAYATAREAPLHTPTSKGVDNTLYYVVYGDPYTPFAQTDWTSPQPAPINVNYGGHKPDKPANEFAGSVVPDTIQVNGPTQVTVTLLDSLGGGIDSAQVTINGWGYSAVDTTDTLGQAIFNVTAPYGELLLVTGEKESFDTYLDTIYVVGASDFLSANISASVASIGLIDTLAPYYEGVITGVCSESGFTLFAKGCDVNTHTVTSGDSADLAVTPYSTGSIQSVIGKPGYNLYLENIPVINVYGTLSGLVTDSATSDSLANVRVRGYTHGADTSLVNPVFSVLNDPNGVYTVGFDLAVGEYDLYVQHFGYLPFAGTTMVMYGANSYDIALSPAPSGTVSGMVYEETTMNPLTATIRIFRNDNMELYTTIYTNSSTGGTYSVDLPYFTYLFKVTSSGHKRLVRDVIVDSESQTQDFKMSLTSGVLVIDDDSGKRLKGKTPPVEVTVKDKGQSATTFVNTLTDMGYSVTSETASSTDPELWPDYSLVIWSSGTNTSPVSEASYRTNLINFVNSGGKLLIEGGEIGYDAVGYPGYPDFASAIVHVIDWNADNSGNLTLLALEHPLATIPNILPEVIDHSYSSYGNEDALDVASDATGVYGWTNASGSGVIAYNENGDPQAEGQIAYFSFDITNTTNANFERDHLIENAIYFLGVGPPAPPGSISGVIKQTDETPVEGAIVVVEDKDFSDTTTTSQDGSYQIGGLKPGIYKVTASKLGYFPYSSSIDSVEVFSNQDTPNINFTLDPIELGAVSGTVTLSNTSDYSGVIVKIVGTELSDTTKIDGGYSISNVPPGDQTIRAFKSGYRVEVQKIYLPNGGELTEINFILNPISGDVLIINDDDGTRNIATREEPVYVTVKDFSKSAAVLETTLTSLGYKVTVDSSSQTDPVTWLDYDLLVWSDGSNASPLEVSQYRTDLENYVKSGGKLFIEGGEIAWSAYEGAPDAPWTSFRRNILHIPEAGDIWDSDVAGDLKVTLFYHPIVTVPNDLSSTISFTYSGVTCSDAVNMQSGTDADVVIGWTDYPSDPGVLAYDDDSDLTNGGQIVFYTFDVANISETEERQNLIDNTVTWLIGEPVGVKGSSKGSGIPAEYFLSQNYPNPFNPVTQIGYGLPKAGIVKLEVYNVLGQRVATLVGGHQKAGYYRVSWDGSTLASGVYLYRLTAGDWVQTRKLVLIR